MKVEEILKKKGRDVATTTADTGVQMALHRLTALNIGALVVTADGSTVEGMLSERDVVRAVEKHGRAFVDLTVREVMSRNVPSCAPSDTLTEVMAIMTRTRQRHLPVIDRAGALCGVVSIGDIVKRRLDELELETGALRSAYIAHR